MSEKLPPDPTNARKWVMVGVVFVIMGLSAGLTFYSLAIFIDELTIHKGFSLTLVSFAVTLSSFGGGAGGVLAARLLRRFSVRAILIVGVAAGGLGLVWVGHARDPWQLCLSFVAMGFSLALVGYVPCTDLLARTFHPSPGRAITIASTGLSLGGAVMPPAVHAIVVRFGLSQGTIIIAVALVLVVMVGTLLIKDPPRVRVPAQSSPLGTDSALPTQPGSFVNTPIWRRLENLRMPGLPRGVALLTVAFGLLMLSQGATVIHLLRIAREAGVTDGAALLSIIAVVSIITRFTSMLVLARVKLKWFSLGVAIVQAAAQVAFSFATGMPGLMVASVLMGISVGNMIVLMSLFVLAGFDLSVYASIYALVGLGTTVGSGIGPLFLGSLASLLGSYGIPLLGLAVASVLGAVALLRTGIDSDPRTLRA